ncbi:MULTISPECIES: hypothetical protein [unclassified Paenibacillus]|uniref:hypothetical protein n=1 Tax=unclassified Paenibacillus TaxID=185978 RepID=UPI0024071E16|nr:MULTISPECIES: hypothetical protein [unclassified Paenibacillus]MDF9840319.1 exonuclease VII small subunit [Paenibacillus sp. PastF-2]MDF9846901.1 exonuclease VII small subunit [Paenibacillus sp. PastM-2]MDF9853473.1 exonuclease VII small subunit [Paenibacillus sp. PastF-1]MDH6479040.1 exonuclease VII small subunit [Paenibacillus sp. PastH-2]MDH6506772.1 exonuclease VII small subunit [Paenibacillus sp. PastM-3]
MDKSKVIAAYRRGFLTVRECGQILGVEELQLQSLLSQVEGKQRIPEAQQRIGS